MTPHVLRTWANIADKAADQTFRLAMTLHGLGRHDEAFRAEQMAERASRNACDLRIQARQSGASEGVRAAIFETVQPRSAA